MQGAVGRVVILMSWLSWSTVLRGDMPTAWTLPRDVDRRRTIRRRLSLECL